jgi:hypothetical protein
MKFIDIIQDIWGNGSTRRGLTGPIGSINIEYLAKVKSDDRMYISTNISEGIKPSIWSHCVGMLE